MENYSWMRAFADSWMLLAMFLFFAAIVFWAFRPGSRRDHEDSANLIFRNEKTPAGEGLKEAKK